VALGGLRGAAGRMKRVAAKGNKASALVRSAAAAKRRQDLIPVIEEMRSNGAGSLRSIAAALNERGIRTARGLEWTATQVSRVIAA
jgi:hypothetical protein